MNAGVRGTSEWGFGDGWGLESWDGGYGIKGGAQWIMRLIAGSFGDTEL